MDGRSSSGVLEGVTDVYRWWALSPHPDYHSSRLDLLMEPIHWMKIAAVIVIAILTIAVSLMVGYVFLSPSP